eukprot:CAMPEP_0202359712 /NCGR_PEP_ID=MMETSP1126-20121109/12915_1 /ASSEMBLY_ACC=CAM_ASM_000457 /TAXON_ID=3047 /ORGANISM="Dunaliella tertiolecta, Strain CCMP1320" /LENGTH=37 /DNA_ID= /DNA_START= /DNA_END= /DNA_ORIENTATION=
MTTVAAAAHAGAVAPRGPGCSNTVAGCSTTGGDATPA